MTSAPVSVHPSPMGLGDVFGTTFSVFRRRIGMFLGLTGLQLAVNVALLLLAVVVAVVATGGVLVMTASGLDTYGGLESAVRFLGVVLVAVVVATVVSGLVSVYFSGLIVVCAHEATQQRFPTFAELRGLAKGVVGRYVGLYLLAALAYLVGAVVASAPLVIAMTTQLAPLISSAYSSNDELAGRAAAAIIGGVLGSMALYSLLALVAFVVQVKLAYVMQVCAIERLSGMAALRRAWNVTKGAFWRTLGYLLVFSLAAGAASSAVSSVGRVFTQVVTPSSSTSSASDVLSQIQWGAVAMASLVLAGIMLAVELLVVPLRLTYVTVMYGDQVNRALLGPVSHAFGVPGAAPYGYQAQPGYGAPQRPYSQPGYGSPQGYGPAQGTGYAGAPGYGPAQGGYAGSGYGPQPGYGQGPTGYASHPGQPATYPGQPATYPGQAYPPAAGQQPPYGQG